MVTLSVYVHSGVTGFLSMCEVTGVWRRRSFASFALRLHPAFGSVWALMAANIGAILWHVLINQTFEEAKNNLACLANLWGFLQNMLKLKKVAYAIRLLKNRCTAGIRRGTQKKKRCFTISKGERIRKILPLWLTDIFQRLVVKNSKPVHHYSIFLLNVLRY